MSCEHYQTVEDEREGTVVCISCGLVLDQLYIYQQYSDNSELNISITDICANHNIPTSIAQKCTDILQHIQTTISSRRFPKNVLIAYAVYQGLLENDVVRSPTEILNMTGVELSRIYDVEKALTSITNTVMPSIIVKSIDTRQPLRSTSKATFYEYPTPQLYIERFSTQCGLSFQDIQNITSYCKHIVELCENCASQTVAASLILYYCKTRKLKTTIRDISTVCMVSVSSIYRIQKKIKVALKYVRLFIVFVLHL